MTKRVNETTRRRLRARFREVLARYRSTQQLISDELDSREIEEVENAVELWDSEVLSSISDVDVAILADVLAAIRRVVDGTYGRCIDCQVEIPANRLAAIPEAARCIECARREEPSRHRTPRKTG